MPGPEESILLRAYTLIGCSAPSSTAGSRYLEFVRGGSSKFWEIRREGRRVSIRFGRIGTGGQMKPKESADEAAAARDVESLLREKTGKGYAERRR